MSRRYSRIRDGARYAAALERYVQHLQTAATRPRRIGQQGARGNTLPVYFVPFNFDIGTTERYKAMVKPDDYTALSTYINGADTGAEVTNALGANTLVSEQGFRAARIVWFRNASRSTTVVNSQVTGQPYQKYNGDRLSCAFGRKLENDDQIDSFNRVKAAILSAGGFAVNRVSLSREVAPI